MHATIKDGKLIIELPMQAPTPSKSSGKTLIVAKTGGNLPTPLQVEGKTVFVGATAYIKAAA